MPEFDSVSGSGTTIINKENEMVEKLYAPDFGRDIEAQGKYYVKHISAMTAEGLHNKSDIAAELAHRDMKIDEYVREIIRLNERIEELELYIECESYGDDY